MVVGQLGKLRDGCQPSRGPIDNRPAGYQSGYQPAPQADDSSRGQTSRKRSWRLPGCYGASEATRNAALEFGGFERQPILAAAGSQPAMAECEDSHAPRKAVSEGGCGQDCPPTTAGNGSGVTQPTCRVVVTMAPFLRACRT